MAEDKDLIRSLCDLEIPNAIKFSPDGLHVLYSTALTWGHYKGQRKVSTLWLAKTGQARSSRQLTHGTFNDYAAAWVPDGTGVVFISDRAKAGEKWAIYFLSLEGGEAEAITPVGNEQPISMFKISPGGKSIAYLSADEKTPEQNTLIENKEDVQAWGDGWEYGRLCLVDVSSKQVRTLVLDRHVTDFCWSPDGRQIAIASCETPDIESPWSDGTDLSIVDVASFGARHSAHFPKMIYNLAWAVDGNLYFCGGVPAGKAFGGSGVYAVNPAKMDSDYIRVAFGLEDDAVGLSNCQGRVLAHVQKRLESRICSLDGRVLWARQEELEAFDVHYSANGEEMLLAVATSNVSQPVEVYTSSTTGNEHVQLSNHGQAFQDRRFGACTFLSCPSTDGEVKLDALFLAPANPIASHQQDSSHHSLPTIVLIHGGPNTRLTNAFNTYYYMLAPYLLSRGYGILVPNYRGSSGGGQKFASYSIGGLGHYDYDDVITLTQHAIEQGHADQERLMVGGWSQGGFLTNLCCTRNGAHGHGWKYKAAIPGASIADIDSMALTSDLGGSFEAELSRDAVIWNMDKSDTRNRDASALWEFKAAMERSRRDGQMVIPPMLILHGEMDARCPLSQAQGLRRALQQYKLPFEFVTYPRQGHFFQEQKFWVDMIVRVGRWCDKYIGPGQTIVQ